MAEGSSQVICKAIHRLRALTRRSQHSWHQCPKALAPSVVLQSWNWQQWPVAAPNERGHIAWPRGQRPLWLCQEISVPDTLDGFPLAGLSLRLGLTWWAELAQVYVDGNLVQEGDLFDCFTRILLCDRVTPGDTFTVAIFLRSPGHDDGALVRAEVIYEAAAPETPEPGFVADELAVLTTYAEALAPERLADIAAAIAPLDWSTLGQEEFQGELAALRQRLRPLSSWIKQHQIACVGHAHLDLAWLWPVEDTWRAAERTFRSVLSLQASFPALTYTHSSPALFEWLETYRPALFQQVVDAVKSGQWAIDAGLWVEPELNTISGESLAHQILYGQRYAKSRFGEISAIAWLPDSFGFSWQLPQLFALGGIRCFATQKLRWNEATPFPHGLFWWQGLDGTRILSLTLPPIGSDIDPVQMATHGAEWVAKTGQTEMLWLPGMGDHGGGPTRDMLEKAQRWAESPFFPKLAFTSVSQHLENLSGRHSQLPVWTSELYLELHRGCYTVHADQKWFNRRCEEALREAELFATVGKIQGVFDYPKAALEAAWKQVLFNQFHDILPGTAIPEVFATANAAWQSAYDTANAIRSQALAAIAGHIPLPAAPQESTISVVVFNSLSWERSELVQVELGQLSENVRSWAVFDPMTGTWLPCQLSPVGSHANTPPCQPSNSDQTIGPWLLFPAKVPPVGYRVFWLVPNGESVSSSPEDNLPPEASGSPWQLENDHLQAVVDPETGDLTKLWHKATQHDVVRSPANQLQAFRDSGQYWDAWDIAPDYGDHPCPPTRLKSIEWLERGPLRQRLRVVKTLGDSTFQQDYVLDQPSPYLRVETAADWHETQVVLKVAFPLAVQSDHATYEIPFGAIARPTQPTDPHEQAKWEAPALRWADLSNDTLGLSILTDYKHGFDVQPDQMRLTLLKAPLWPDPTADRGRHWFAYALYPHGKDWREGKTPRKAIGFGTPMSAVVTQDFAPSPRAALPIKSYLNLGTEAVGLAAFKPSEDNPNAYILRCWDLYGQGTTLDMQTAWGVPNYQHTDLLEQAIASAQPSAIAPWQIATMKFSL